MEVQQSAELFSLGRAAGLRGRAALPALRAKAGRVSEQRNLPGLPLPLPLLLLPLHLQLLGGGVEGRGLEGGAAAGPLVNWLDVISSVPFSCSFSELAEWSGC